MEQRKYTDRALEMARQAKADARRQFEQAPAHSKEWMDAEENLNFWQGKVASMEVLARHSV